MSSSPAGQMAGETGGEWLSERGLVGTEQTGDVWAESVSFAASCWPLAGPEAQTVLTRWAALCFVLDDTLDAQCAGEPAGERLRLTGHLTRLLEGTGGPAAGGPYDNRFTRAFDEVWRHLAAPMSHGWRQRFLGHCLEYLHAAAWEAQNRARNTPPSTVDYIHRRRNSSGNGPRLDLVEYAVACRLPTGFHTLPAVRAALTAATDIAGWHNDLVSLPREEARGDPNTRVLAVAQERRCDQETAIGLVRARLRSRMHDFDRSTARHARQARHRKTHGPHATRYLAGLRAWVHGTLTWHTDARRYRTVSS